MSIPSFSLKSQVSGFKLEDAKPALRNSNLKLETRNLKLGKSVGLSLVELIVFIVVVGVAVAGVLAALNVATRASADPMVQKQALAIAEALLEEVQLQPFTYCDPDDANAATALNPAGCATTAEAIGPEAGETRLNAVTPFDNVNDYNTFSMVGGITDITGGAITGLDAYTATVGVATQSLDVIAGTDASGAPQSLLITVTVTGPGNTTVTLHGYRTRYAPNALP